MCKDEDIQNSVSDCVSRACTLREGIEFQNSVSSICNVPTADNRGMYRDIIIVFATFSFAFVVLRVVSKLIVKTPWGPDDTWAIIAFHIFIWQILSILGLAAAKTSILFFYLRIFPDEKFRIIVWMTIAFNAVSIIVTLVLNLTLGQAVRIIWDGGTDYNSSLKTYNVVFKVGLANNAVSFALDIWMLILPMTQLYNLGLRQRQKIKVMSMFGMGVFLPCSALYFERLAASSQQRLTRYQPHYSQSCPTCDSVKGSSKCEHIRHVYLSGRNGFAHAIVILGNVELYVGVMVACGPSANQLVQYVLPRIRQPIEASSQASNRPVFVDRSLAQIEKDEDVPTLHTDGGLTTTTICSTIRDTA
ncbi:unnamed protein product [Fusarium venenatum]|uniref:Rhodopsin domain-containing protein n=1 Tax=Fusarium venenatum TaxID=56646 RepID=A0A2L2T8Y5_9HYPO|nr:LOW QUALITY PROTEIN: uncharacterized protein FVRRES_02801 [Fusarium venenatum]CEI66289.1 unnamed protein product [Fusarium venenatum]